MSRLAVEVSRAREADLDDVFDLWTQGRDEVIRLGRSPISAEHLRPRLTQAMQAGQAEVVIARRDGQPAGFVILREPAIAFMSESAALCIEQLYVARSQRRHGVARAMLSYVAGRAERSACDQILTSVTPWARETHRFFARLGFVPVTVHRSVTPSILRRRLTGESSRGGLDDLISRRRSLRAKARVPVNRPAVHTTRVEGPITGEHPRLA